MNYPKMYILLAILEWNKRKEHVSKVEIRYNKKILFYISLFLACETLVQEKIAVYLSVSRQLDAFNGTILYASSCYFAYYFSSGLW